ncbi:MAG: flavodoxin family protein [Deltaproteobacteria bacterium]|nr:flavodoxin family protein [Deltaproteobacteria bacterium]
MRVLGLSCSPRREGNTDLLLREFLRGARELGAETYRLDACSLRISPCKGCGACEKTGRCVVDDEMQRVYDRIDEAAVVALASPIYFYNVTAQCKILIDRCQALWSRKYILKMKYHAKKGFFLSVGATRGKKMFDCAVLTVKYFFDAVGAVYAGDLLFCQVEGRGEIRNHPTALRQAYEAGAGLAGGVHKEKQH